MPILCMQIIQCPCTHIAAIAYRQSITYAHVRDEMLKKSTVNMGDVFRQREE